MDSFQVIWEGSGEPCFAVRALVDGQVVGEARGHWEQHACELERVEVGVAWRRHGIGRSLIEELQDHADHIRACVVSEAGAGLLRRCGFEDFAEPEADWAWPPDWLNTGDHDF